MTQSFDSERAAAFAGKVLDVINHGSIALMILAFVSVLLNVILMILVAQ